MSPRYAQIYDDLCRRLSKGEWQAGDRLPGIHALMKHYETPSLNTVRSAQQLLVNEGVLRTEQGRGTYVVALPDTAADSAALLEKLQQARRLLVEVEKALRS